MKYYAVLGVLSNATIETITAAYRRMAQTEHPDKKPGNDDAFKLIQEAYNVLSDPDKRARYDKGEDPNAAQPLDVASVLAELCLQVAGGDAQDVVETMRNHIRGEKQRAAQSIEGLRLGAKRADELTARIKRCNGEENILAGALISQAAKFRKQIDAITAAEARLDLMLKALEEYYQEPPQFDAYADCGSVLGLLNSVYRGQGQQ